MSAGPWLSKHNFLGLGSIEFKVIGVGPLHGHVLLLPDVVSVSIYTMIMLGPHFECIFVELTDPNV